MVPSEAIAGATFNGGRWVPHGVCGGWELGVGGQGNGSPGREKVPSHIVGSAVPEGNKFAQGVSIAKSSGLILTSHAPNTSETDQGLTTPGSLSCNTL